MRSVLFIDFDDSFSFNVIQELQEIGFRVRVFNWRDFEDPPLEEILILGPGPGHPDDYSRIYPLIRSWLEAEKPFVGICLGHQIYWRIKGHDIRRSAYPVHGQRVRLELDEFWQKFLGLPSSVKVQRYNSLSIISGHEPSGHQILSSNGEMLMSHATNVLTYQFHPESVGTSFRKSFFLPLLKDPL